MTARATPVPARRTARARIAFASVAALSLGAYLRWSRELRYELADPAYKHALLTQFFREHGLPGVRLLRPVSARGALLLGAFVVACALAGVAVRRALGASRGVVEGAALAVGAAVVPAMAIALVLWPDGRGALRSAPWLAGVAAIALAGGAVALRRRREDDVLPVTAADVRERDPGRWWGLVLLVALVPLLLLVWWNGLDAIRGFDSLADHLPRAARWLRLSRLSDESGTLLTPYYPGDFQLLVRWALVLGSDAYAFVPSLAAALASLAVLFGICRELGQSRWTAFVAIAAAASCSLMPYLSTTVEADTTTTAFLLAAVLLLLRWLRLSASPREDGAPRAVATLAALGTSLGLAVGTKYSALPPALAVYAVVAAFALGRSHGRFPDGRRYLNARTFTILLAAVSIPLALCSAYWYVRNLVAHGNPFFPVATAGLPGVDMRYVIPVKPSLTSSLWARITYPWVQWDFTSVYDDGLGAAFAAVALPSFVALGIGGQARGGRRRLVWLVTLASYALWIGTGSITARFGLFPVLLTYAFVGEAWRQYESIPLKAVTVAATLLGVGLTGRSLLVGAVYTSALPPSSGVPAIVDSLPPTRIFNAVSAAKRYRLLGRDYRHAVITMFGPASVAARDSSGAQYELLSASQVRALATGATLVARGAPLPDGDTLSLWRLPGPPR